MPNLTNKINLFLKKSKTRCKHSNHDSKFRDFNIGTILVSNNLYNQRQCDVASYNNNIILYYNNI